MTTSAMVSIRVNSTSATEARMVCVRSSIIDDVDRRRDRGLQLRQRGLDPIDRLDDVGAGLLEDDQADAATCRAARPPACVFSGPSIGLADVADADRRAVAVGDDHVVLVVGGLQQLVVVVDGEGLARAVDAALGRVDAWRWRCTARTSSRPRPSAASLRRVDLDADRRLLLAADDDLADARDLRDLLRQDVVGIVVDLGQRQRVGLTPGSGSARRPG